MRDDGKEQGGRRSGRRVGDCRGSAQLNGCSRFFPARVSGGYSSDGRRVVGTGFRRPVGHSVRPRALRLVRAEARQSSQRRHHLVGDRLGHRLLDMAVVTFDERGNPVKKYL